MVPVWVFTALSPGHKTEAVYRRYAIVAENYLREAGAKLAASLGTGTATTSLGDNLGGHFGDSAKWAFDNSLKLWWAGTGLNRRHQDFQTLLHPLLQRHDSS